MTNSLIQDQFELQRRLEIPIAQPLINQMQDDRAVLNQEITNDQAPVLHFGDEFLLEAVDTSMDHTSVRISWPLVTFKK